MIWNSLALSLALNLAYYLKVRGTLISNRWLAFFDWMSKNVTVLINEHIDLVAKIRVSSIMDKWPLLWHNVNTFPSFVVDAIVFTLYDSTLFFEFSFSCIFRHFWSITWLISLLTVCTEWVCPATKGWQ